MLSLRYIDVFIRCPITNANKPATLEDLKDNNQREIANVPVEICVRVVENWVQRIDRCKRARGGHMTDIEFHS